MTGNIRVLAFSANQVTNALDVDNELRAIRHALDGVATVAHLPAARAEELVSDLSANPPVAMHFMGHGSPLGLELAYGRDDYRPANGQALRDVLTGRGVQLVVLSACYSAAQAHQLAQSVDVVVGTPEALEDDSSVVFSSTFYRALRRGATAAEALKDGQDAVRLQHTGDQFEIVGDGSWRLPVGQEAQTRQRGPGNAVAHGRPATQPASPSLNTKLAVGLAALVFIAIAGFAARLLIGGDDGQATATDVLESDVQGAADLDVQAAAEGVADQEPGVDPAAPSESEVITSATTSTTTVTTSTTTVTTSTTAPASSSSSTASSVRQEAADEGPTDTVPPPTINPDFPNCQSGSVILTSAPAGGEVQPGSDGCPTLTNNITTPFRSDQWTLNLTQGQTISYTLDSNVYWNAVTITAPDGTTLTNVTSRADFNGQINAPTTGTYTITLENSDYTRTKYTLTLWDITNPTTKPSSINPATFNPCPGGPVIPATLPVDGEVQPGSDGCPTLTNNITTPFRSDQWTLNLTQGQTISYTLDSNVYWNAVTITAPDGTTLTNVTSRADFNGQITAPTTGTYTITLENSDYTRTKYTLTLWDITQ